MGKKLTREDLKLVSDFSAASHPYEITQSLEKPLDGAELMARESYLKHALAMAHVTDYKIFKSAYEVSVHLRTEEDFERTSIALRPDTAFEEPFVTAPEGYDFRKLKNRRNNLQSIIDRTNLQGLVRLGIDRGEKTIVACAPNKDVYLAFRAMMNNPAFDL